MSEEIVIQYPTALLNEEIPQIRESILCAMRPVFQEADRLFLEALGLKPGDSEILAQYRSAKAPWSAYQQMTKKPFSELSFPEAVEALAQKAKSTGNDDELRDCLQRLDEPVTSADPLDLQSIAERVLVDGKEGAFLVLRWMPFRWSFDQATFSADIPEAPPIHWIEPSAAKFFERSLCFYSDRALAEVVHLIKGGTKPIPRHRWGLEEKRIAKIRERLGLLRARRRIWKEWKFASDMRWMRLVPFAARLAKKPDKSRS